MRQFARGDGERVDIAAMAVDDQQAREADGAQGADDAAEHAAQLGEIEAYGAAERQMVLAHPGPEPGQHENRHLVGHEAGGADGGGAGACGVGDDREVRAMLLERADRQHGERVRPGGDGADLWCGQPCPFHLNAHRYPLQLAGVMRS